METFSPKQPTTNQSEHGQRAFRQGRSRIDAMVDQCHIQSMAPLGSVQQESYNSDFPLLSHVSGPTIGTSSRMKRKASTELMRPSDNLSQSVPSIPIEARAKRKASMALAKAQGLKDSTPSSSQFVGHHVSLDGCITADFNLSSSIGSSVAAVGCQVVTPFYCSEDVIQPTSNAESSTNQHHNTKRCNRHHRSMYAPLSLGGPNHVCPYCGAHFWYEERVRGHGRVGSPIYNKCCKGGSIILPSYNPPPEPLLGLLIGENSMLSGHFYDYTRYYNSMYALTSMGATVINSINDGRGPYVFKISGQLCHRIGSLLPVNEARPEYCQLYIFDTENEIKNRIAVASHSEGDFQANETIVAALTTMLNQHNPIVQLFRTACDRLSHGPNDNYSIRLFAVPNQHGNVYSAPIAPEVVGLVINDLGSSNEGRDLIVEDHASRLQKVQETHCKFMAMQYPLLFPYGEDRFHDELRYRRCPRSEDIQRTNVTMLEYYAYRLHDRDDDFNTPLRCKKLTQAYQVDSYCCVEDSRLRHYRKRSFQLKYRTGQFKSLVETVNSGIIEASSTGQRIILPSSYTGSPRYYYQNYQDCVAICRRFGCPDLFITFTCNASWPEIDAALAIIPGQRPSDRPDIIDRVFQMKLSLLMDDITKRHIFGPVAGVVYTIEFQKRGLPHVHIILWLKKDRPITVDRIDALISAQLPDPSIDPIGYEAVSKFMIHGPCGAMHPSSPCMIDGKCSKFYPKEFVNETTILSDGYVRYARPDTGITIDRDDVSIDNRFVIPHNVDLLVKYQAHINVESVNRDGMEKYLFKYTTKGPDSSKVGVKRKRTNFDTGEEIDEIKEYLDCRYVTPNDAAWRLLQFDIHHTDPSIERLPVHLPLQNNVVFREDDHLDQVINNPLSTITKLTAWFDANKAYPQALQHTYVDFPEHWTWHAKGRYWAPRLNNRLKIGRIANVGPNEGELFYLRMLLHVVKGAQHYSDIRTISGEQHSTFRSTCEALGLLGDDREWSHAMADAAKWALPFQLRQLFVTLLLFCQVIDPNKLFNEYGHVMGDDVRHRIIQMTPNISKTMLDHNIKSYVLEEVDKLLRNVGYTFKSI